MWELNHKEGWGFWIVMLQKTQESLLDGKEIARRPNQSIIKKINPEHSLEGLMLKWKFQILWPPEWRADSLEKTLMPGKVEGRRRGQQRMRWLDHHWPNGHGFEQTPRDGEGQGSLACHSPWVTKSWTQVRSEQGQQKNCMDWTSPTHNRTHVFISSGNTLTNRHPGTMSNQISRHVKLTITHVKQLSNDISVVTLWRTPTRGIMYHNVSGNIIN